MDFDLKVSLAEETIPRQRSIWNHWTGNGNSGMDAVAPANSIEQRPSQATEEKTLED